MSIHAIVGPEPLRRSHVHALLGGREHRRVDVTNPDELRHAVGSFTLLPTILHLPGIDQLSASDFRRLAAALTTSPHDAVLEAEKLSSTQAHALAGVQITRLAGSGSGYRDALVQSARALGITLGGREASELAVRATDPARAVSVLTALAAAEITAVTTAHIRALAGNNENTGLPWALVEALGRGDHEGLAATADASEPIAVIAYLAKRVLAAVLIAEGTPEQEVGGQIGGATDAALTQARTWARNADAEQLRHTASRLASADAYAKRGHGPEALSLALAAIAPLVRPQ